MWSSTFLQELNNYDLYLWVIVWLFDFVNISQNQLFVEVHCLSHLTLNCFWWRSIVYHISPINVLGLLCSAVIYS